MANLDHWRERVNQVFSINPRVGLDDGKLWIPRDKETLSFDDKFSRLGGHVCLDGPTGSGKTSFVWTYLESKKVKYVPIQITQHLDWPGFCHLLIDGRENEERGISADAEIGIDKGLPVLKSRISLGWKGRYSDGYDFISKASQTWTEHDVARMLRDSNATLLLDDVEVANDILLSRLADLSRLLSQTFLAKHAKIIFVGKDAIYHKLYQHNISLEGRLFQVSLGGFPTFGTSVSLIRKGLTLLRLRNPWRPQSTDVFQNVPHCERRIWEAADGSPKMLNVLGNNIASRAFGFSFIGWREIVSEAEKMLQDEWIRHSTGFPQIISYLDDHPMAEEIVRFIYNKGIYNVFRTNDILKHLCTVYASISISDITKHVEGLCSAGFCVLTGQAQEIIFVRQPTAAHHLGVALLNPSLFQKQGELTKGRRQYQFYDESALVDSKTDEDDTEEDEDYRPMQ